MEIERRPRVTSFRTSAKARDSHMCNTTTRLYMNRERYDFVFLHVPLGVYGRQRNSSLNCSVALLLLQQRDGRVSFSVTLNAMYLNSLKHGGVLKTNISTTLHAHSHVPAET